MTKQGFSLHIEDTVPYPVAFLTTPSTRLSPVDIEQFEEILCRIEDEHPDSLLVLRNETDFCLGLDYADLGVTTAEAEQAISRSEKALRHFVKLSNPKLAILTGESRGWGASLALCSDICTMHNQAQMTWDELRFGLTPGSATWLLPQYVGLGRANDLLLTGRSVAAEEALQWGLVQRIFPNPDAVQVQVNEFATHLSQVSISAFRATRKLVREAWSNSYANSLGPCLAAQAMCLPDLITQR